MMYNSRIQKLLDNLSNDVVRRVNDSEHPGYIFDNQIDAAKEIIKSFTAHWDGENEETARNSHVILCARMQSGKTGTCNGVVNILEKTGLDSYFGIQKYFFISGMNDRGLSRQTLKRINGREFDINTNGGQIINATIENTVFQQEIEEKIGGKYFVQKNSDLRKNIELKNCLIFIDESHYGSGEESILTQLLKNNGIDWKNKNELKSKNIFVVSVSATPFDEVISDLAECKTIVELKVTEGYYGVSDFMDKGLIYQADKADFDVDDGKILDLIKEAFDRMEQKKGIIIIRASEKKQKIILEDDFVLNNFQIEKISSETDPISYRLISSVMTNAIYEPGHKPVIFLIKGSFRAGITLKQQHKDYIYLIYDFSPSRQEASAQGLLGRMCGYRSNEILIDRTHFYVNQGHAEKYRAWELSGFSRIKTPAGNAWEWLDFSGGDRVGPNDKIIMGTKGIGNFTIYLSETQREQFITIIKNLRGVDKKIAIFDFLKPPVCLPEFQYIGEVYVGRFDQNSKEGYSQAVKTRWFDYFVDGGTNILGYRTDSHFKYLTGRDDLDYNRDFGKKIIHIVMDADYDEETGLYYGDSKILVYYGELNLMKYNRSVQNYLKEHKDTSKI